MSTNEKKNTNKPARKSVARKPKPKGDKADPEERARSRKSEVGSPKSEVPKERARSWKSEVGSPKSEVPKERARSQKSEVGSPKSEVPKERAKSQESRAKKPEEEHSAIDSPQPELKETPTANPQPQPMEVHHHPQLDHKPKPWKEYLLEGLMIFLAVMMGFIAENIREDITNGEHARQLTSQLVQDLKSDIAQLDYIYRNETEIVKSNDTLFKLSQQPLAKTDTKKIQKFVVDSHSMWPFHPSGGAAIGAIKNELHLKQFSNSDIISYISSYEFHIELLRTAQDINLQYQRNYLDPFLRLHFTPANLDAAFNHTSVPNSQMRNLTQEDLTQLGADVVLIKVVSKEMVSDNRKLRNDAVKMLQYVTKQYDLEE